MKVMIIGSEGLNLNIDWYLPARTTEILSGGVGRIDALAHEWADRNNIPKRIPEPSGRKWPALPGAIRRYRVLVREADMVVVLWDGHSLRERIVIGYARRIGKPLRVVRPENRWFTGRTKK